MARFWTLVALAAPATARAGIWDAPPEIGVIGGASVVVALGADPDRARVGFGLDAGYQWFWHGGSDGPLVPGPLGTVAVHAGWTKPYLFAEVTAVAGAMYPALVADGGFVQAIGAQAGGGLGIATDGWAGPVLVGALLGPLVEARIEAARRDADWHAPRLAIGASLPLNCCSYELAL